MPAPPPNGVSSTWPPLRGVWSRGLSVRTSCPPASALATWRWARNHSNHSGKSVTTSSCTSGALGRGGRRPGSLGQGRRGGVAEERDVDVDDLRRDVDVPDGVAHERHEERLVRARAGHLERLARRKRDEPSDVAELAVAVDHAAALEVPRPPLVLLERRRGLALNEQLDAPQVAGRLAAVDAVEAQDRAFVGPRAADDLGLAAAGPHDDAEPQEAPARLEDVERALEPVRADLGGPGWPLRARAG